MTQWYTPTKLKVALILALVLQILLVVGGAVAWYSVEASVFGGKVTTTFYLDHQELGDTSCKYTDDNNTCKFSSDEKTMWGLILTCVILANLVCFLVAVLLTVFSFPVFSDRAPFKRALRIVLLVFVVLLPVLVLLAWCLLFWINKANNGLNDFKTDFVQDSNGLKTGPQAGWGLYVSATPFAIVVAILAALGGIGSSSYSVI